MSIGFVSDGEFNELRAVGYTRPLSIFKVRANVRAKYAKMGKMKLMKMITVNCEYSSTIITFYKINYRGTKFIILTFVSKPNFLLCIATTLLANADGTITAETPSPSVPERLLKEIWQLRQSGLCYEDIIDRLRSRTVPQGYPIHSWKPGTVIIISNYL